MANYLEGQSLLCYVDGSLPCPPQYITADTTTIAQTINSAYHTWYHHDKQILFALISSLSVPILATIVGKQTSINLWLTLEKMFSSQSKARIMHSRYELSTLKKGAMSIVEYFQLAQTSAYTLASCND